MLIAVSTSNDPTDTWYKYSFDVADMPDYEKFGIWQDGYYMGTNNNSGNDIYVFERSLMLSGDPNAQAVGFDNPWRPTTIDGFMCVPPLDNDGDFAPAGEPGLFITINDDAIGGGSDQLWIYELDVDWTTPGNSTFDRVQQLDVDAFDSDFGNNWDNIKQQGTSQELDAIPMVIMNPPQYRNFGTYETIVCCHTVDVDDTDHAGIRWYELRRVSSGDWTVRQQGTYAPDDGHSRWMGSVMLNGQNEIGLGYSISSENMYPGIRYCGQSSADYLAATGFLDIPEENIQNSLTYQSTYNRWGDYAALQVDPVDDQTFWFTTQYVGSGGTRKTKIASFTFGPEILNANFSADNLNPQIDTTVQFTDLSTGPPTDWEWTISPATYTFVGGTTFESPEPHVQFTAAGPYSITLTVSDGVDSDIEPKADYITAIDCSNITMPVAEDFSTGSSPECWSILDNEGNGQVWQFNNPGGRTVNTTSSVNGFAILDSDNYGSGNSQNSDLITPSYNFTDFASIILTFEHYFRSWSGSSATLSFSTDGGTSWTSIQTWTVTTDNAVVFNQDLSTQLAGQANVKFKWNYTGTYGYYWAVDDISITGSVPNEWTGETSDDWNTNSNWSNGSVPSGNTTAVTISSTADNWPVFPGDLTLGVNIGSLTISAGAQMAISGNLTINTDYSLVFAGDGLLSIGQNWTNNGVFVPGTGTIEFTGTSPATINPSGGGSGIATYQRSTFTKGMVPLTGGTTGPTGDDGNTDVSIGFSFDYAGINYSQARISTNGWVSLSQTGSSGTANASLFNEDVPNATLAPWWDDLSDDATSVVYYKTEGDAPNRIFTAEWNQVLTYYTGSTARISFQVKLFESSNMIEFHYGNLISGDHNTNESASSGIEDASGGSGHFIEATTGSTTTGVTNLVSTSDWPTANYSFTPPEPVETFENVIVNKNSTYLDINTNTTVNGTFNVHNGAYFNVKSGKTLMVQGTVVE